MSPSLERFKVAQRDPRLGFQNALAELRSGRKTSHWIWYVFPQLAALGRSATAKFYGLRDLAEACDYLNDAELRQNLLSIAIVVAEQLERGRSLEDLMGGATDALKLVSSLTLFEQAALGLRARAPSSEVEQFARVAARNLTLVQLQAFPRCGMTLKQTQTSNINSV